MVSAWTWLLYAAVDSAPGEPDVAGKARDSIRALMAADRGASVRAVVQIDAAGTGAQRFEVGAGGAATKLGQLDSGDPASLLDFVRWGVQLAPAERYALILWSHGSGWQPDYKPQAGGDRGAVEAGRAYFSSTRRTLEAALPNDRAIAGDSGSRQAIDTLELGRVAADVAALMGGRLDLLLMNACQMACAEVAYQLRKSVGVYVATEVNMPTVSLPYKAILSGLGAAPQSTADELGALMVRQYCGFMRTWQPPAPWRWGQTPFPPGATLTALRPASLGGVVAAVKALAAAMNRDLAGHMDALNTAVRGAIKEPAKSEFHLGDLAFFAELLLARADLPAPSAAAARNLIAAAKDPTLIVAREANHQSFGRSAGLTTFLPLYKAQGGTTVADSYAGLDYARDSGWAALMRDWHALYLV